MAQLPPFCPNKACDNHTQPEETDWFRPFGWFHTKAHGRVRRYACQKCGKTFSDQTFRLSYYLHLNIAFKDILSRLGACSEVRAMAKHYQVTDKVIVNRIGRLARQVIGVMAGLRGSQDCCEPLVADGFENCSRSQYIHYLTGKGSRYIYALDLAHIHRTGQMTDLQKPKQDQLEKGDLYVSFERICQAIDELAKGNIVLYMDEKKEYRAVLEATQYLDGRVTHLTTTSFIARTFPNPLWTINAHEQEFREDQALKFVDTSQWSQEANTCMERMYACAGFHNFWKPSRGRQWDPRTHAEKARYDTSRIRFYLETIFTERFFYSKVAFSVSEWLVWLRAYRAPFQSSAQYLPGYITGKPRLVPLARAA